MATAWETRFNNHTLWSTVDQMTEILGDISTSPDPDQSADLQRIRLVVETLAQHREEDAARYTNSMLDRVYSALSSNIPSWLGQYRTDPSAYAASLRSASDGLDPVIDQIALLPSLTPKGAASAAGRAAKAYQDASEEALASLLKGVEDLRAEVAEMQTTAEQFADDSASKLDRRLSEKLEQQDASWGRSLETLSQQLVDSADIIEGMRLLSHEAKNIAEAVAEKAVARSYRRNAINKSVGGWIWDGIGTLIGLAGLGLLAYHLLVVKEEATVSLSLTRTAVSIAGLGLAALCFQRASKYHEESRIAKRADIRLTTVDSFVANLEPDTRTAVLEGIAERIYMRGDLESVSEEDPHFRSLRDRLAEIVARRTADEEEPVGR